MNGMLYSDIVNIINTRLTFEYYKHTINFYFDPILLTGNLKFDRISLTLF